MQARDQVTYGPSTSKAALSDILAQLGRVVPTRATTQNTVSPQTSVLADFKEASSPAKALLVTLHFLFPHELLPALDLLDRGLITQLVQQEPGPHPTVSSVFYVQSASAVTDPVNRRAPNSRFRNAWNATRVYYEVRLDAWNCTCAAFAQSQLKLLLLGHSRDPAHEPGEMTQQASLKGDANDNIEDVGRAQDVEVPGQNVRLAHNLDGEYSNVQHVVGGEATTWDAPVPICKHILAASLVIAAPHLFGQGMSTRRVSKEELAGWVAGWNDIGER